MSNRLKIMEKLLTLKNCDSMAPTNTPGLAATAYLMPIS